MQVLAEPALEGLMDRELILARVRKGRRVSSVTRERTPLRGGHWQN
jgi:hypothetical protein